jgi:hypothetical protein
VPVAKRVGTPDGGRSSQAWLSLPLPATDRLTFMRRLRQIAFAILFAGWMLPAFLAQAARERAPKNVPDRRTPFEIAAGIAGPPPAPAERMASMFSTIAVLWFLIAILYAAVLATRLRRTLVR